MSSKTVSVNCLVRDEPLAFFAVASVAPHVNEVLIYDTGSNPENLGMLSSLLRYFSNVKITIGNLPNAHNWTNGKSEGLRLDFPEEVGKAIGDVRREMQAASFGDFIWILDGDEVYPEKLAHDCANLMKNENLLNKDAGFLSFIDLLDQVTVRHIHKMGRLFRRNAVEVRGNYPCEMHHAIATGNCLEPHSPQSLVVRNDAWPVFHYESVVKPWRKLHTVAAKLKEAIAPEVFKRFPTELERLRIKNYEIFEKIWVS